MKNFDDPQDVIRMLQGPPTNAELDGQAAAVDMMAGAQTPPVAAVRRGRRPYRLGALIAAGVIGFGSVAAAGPGGFDPFQLGPTPDEVEDEDVIVEDQSIVEDPPEEVVVDDDDALDDEQESPEEDVEAEEPVAPAAIEEVIEPVEPVMEDNLATPFPENLCVDGPHGATVSQVARGIWPGFDEEDGKDITVVDAAHSDCGKKHAESEGVESDVDDDLDEDVGEAPMVSDDAETETERVEQPGKGKGANGSQGKDNGNGKGKGKGGRGG